MKVNKVLASFYILVGIFALPAQVTADECSPDTKQERDDFISNANRLKLDTKIKSKSEAMTNYGKAFDLCPKPMTALNIAALALKLDRKLIAAEFFSFFLGSNSNAADVQYVAKARKRLNELERGNIKIEFPCAADKTCRQKARSLNWRIDNSITTLPKRTPVGTPLYIGPGDNEVTVSASMGNGIFYVKTFRAWPAGLTVMLEKASTQWGDSPDDPHDEDDDEPFHDQPPETLKVSDSADNNMRKYGKIGAWTGGGLAVLGAGLIIGGYASGDNAYDAYKGAKQKSEITDHRTNVESAKNTMIAGGVILGLSAAVLGASAYLLLAETPAKDAGQDSVVEVSLLGIAPLKGGGMMSIRSQF